MFQILRAHREQQPGGQAIPRTRRGCERQSRQHIVYIYSTWLRVRRETVCQPSRKFVSPALIPDGRAQRANLLRWQMSTLFKVDIEIRTPAEDVPAPERNCLLAHANKVPQPS